MASVFPVRGRPTGEAISKRISLTSSTMLEQPSFRRKGKKAWEYEGFRIASKRILLHQSMNELRERGRRCDGAGIRISSKRQWENVLKLFCL